MTPKTPNFLENNITSATLKNALLGYYRFERGYPYVVTEFFDADVVVSDKKKDDFFDSEYLAKQAASICVDKLDNPSDKGFEKAIKSGHYSILEHLPLTFLIEDISRACSHQLVRHRIASYSQMSQRYAKVETNEEWYIEPETVKSSLNILNKYRNLMDDIANLYNEMCSKGIPNEDARMILPNACSTSIMVSMNARSLVEQCSKRLCNRAQWEIRKLYTQMVELIKDIYPSVYNMCVPPCKKDGCKEIKPCGNPYEKFSSNE